MIDEILSQRQISRDYTSHCAFWEMAPARGEVIPLCTRNFHCEITSGEFSWIIENNKSIPHVSSRCPKVYQDPKATQPILWQWLSEMVPFSLFCKASLMRILSWKREFIRTQHRTNYHHKTFVLSLTKEADLNSEMANSPLHYVAECNFQYITPGTLLKICFCCQLNNSFTGIYMIWQMSTSNLRNQQIMHNFS